MTARPYVTVSCAISLDGYLDTASPPRLALSNADDFDRVDELRSHHDAILVGARTVRLDNPRLLVRSGERQERRAAAGRAPSPVKATVTATGELDPSAAFFTQGDTPKLVYCPRGDADRIRARLGDRATVVPLGEEVRMADLLTDLGERGLHRLLVEGGGRTLTQFLCDDLVDELQVAVAPLFVGDRRAPRFVGEGAFPWNGERRAVLAETRAVGDVVLLRYALSERFEGAGS
ncbi:dihydrofolate reductase family protein [Leifsonia sp. F6_8S_P_1B]|uniref:Dihydrofolate reductase family protein n=1 Tax=Leifsonia williamsii TaxID=3035919 RepID=A0ABT8KA10_9MICO|nr:dihydrofolate reductase family protein [Leifsonia williamsii]MDN4613882.1 dihydrofolate reductase family protein [Leifsonia williamsii]